MLAFSWLPWPLDEIKSRRDGPRTGNRHFILKKVKFYSRSRKKVTVLNLFYKGAVNAYFLTGSFFKKTVVFEAAIFVGQSEDGAEVRCEVSRRVETAVSRYSGPSGLRFIVCPAGCTAKSALCQEQDFLVKNIGPGSQAATESPGQLPGNDATPLRDSSLFNPSLDTKPIVVSVSFFGGLQWFKYIILPKCGSKMPAMFTVICV